MASTLARQGKNEQAAKHYQTAIQIRPNYATAYNNLGLLLERQAKYAEAMSQFKKALEITPDYGDARKNLQRSQEHHGTE